MQEKYTVFVCSSDRFSDCWDPFFTLFKRYWPEYTGEIILATERISYQFPGLNIVCPCVQTGISRKLTWSEVIRMSLDSVKTSHILLFLEDYFIRSTVDNQRLEEMFNLMIAEDFDHLMLISMPGNNKPTAWPYLVERAQDAPYRISTQIGFWKKEIFLKYLKPHESPWQFELWGSKRAARIHDRFYAIHPDILKTRDYIIDYYIRGAVTKGKWQQSVPEFFAQNKLNPLDFSIRGFYDPDYLPPLKKRIVNRIRTMMSDFHSWFILVFPSK
jgi:hypothetical protein